METVKQRVDGSRRHGILAQTAEEVEALDQHAVAPTTDISDRDQLAPKELASSGVTVNSYCSDIVKTDMWVTIDNRMAEISGTALGATYKKYFEGIALGHVETVDAVAGFVVYLSISDADYMTGQSVLISGSLVFR